MLADRNAPPNQDMAAITSQFAGLLGNSAASLTTMRPISGGKMPMLTRKGFCDITAVEVIHDPSDGWGYLNRALKHYGVWREMGDLPRSTLPDFAPPAVVERVRLITIASRQKAESLIAAKHVELKLAAQGQQAALDLLDDRRYVYRY
jgi:hypothetical protein